MVSDFYNPKCIIPYLHFFSSQIWLVSCNVFQICYIWWNKKALRVFWTLYIGTNKCNCGTGLYGGKMFCELMIIFCCSTLHYVLVSRSNWELTRFSYWVKFKVDARENNGHKFSNCLYNQILFSCSLLCAISNDVVYLFLFIIIKDWQFILNH